MIFTFIFNVIRKIKLNEWGGVGQKIVCYTQFKFFIGKKKRINLSNKGGAGIGKRTFVTPTIHELNP